jgi:succinate dehydrogenase / fumarate reductase flavoprotein subunit
MGGMPTDLNGRVRTGAGEQFCRGLFAAGECACVSIHGANRLGANSLLELVVMGRRAGRAVTQFLDEDPRSLVDLDSAVPEEPAQKTKRLLSQLLEGESQDPGLTAKLRVRLQKSMTGYASVLRTERGLQSCLNELKDLCRRYEQVRVHDRGSQFNMELWAAVELGNLLLLAETLVTCALARKESRGAHYRKDHPNRDDDNWLKHSFVCLDSGQELKLTYRPVTITRFDPEARDY